MHLCTGAQRTRPDDGNYDPVSQVSVVLNDETHHGESYPVTLLEIARRQLELDNIDYAMSIPLLKHATQHKHAAPRILTRNSCYGR